MHNRAWSDILIFRKGRKTLIEHVKLWMPAGCVCSLEHQGYLMSIMISNALANIDAKCGNIGLARGLFIDCLNKSWFNKYIAQILSGCVL